MHVLREVPRHFAAGSFYGLFGPVEKLGDRPTHCPLRQAGRPARRRSDT